MSGEFVAAIVFMYSDGSQEAQKVHVGTQDECRRCCDLIPGVTSSDSTLTAAEMIVMTRDRWDELDDANRTSSRATRGLPESFRGAS